MNCDQADMLLIDYLYGELSESQRKELELHLQACSVHAKEVGRLRAVLAVMREDRREDPSAIVTNKILLAARESIRRTSRPWGWLDGIRTPIAAAAALVMVIGIGGVVYFSSREQMPSFDERGAVETLSGPVARYSPDAAKREGEPVTDKAVPPAVQQELMANAESKPALAEKSAGKKSRTGFASPPVIADAKDRSRRDERIAASPREKAVVMSQPAPQKRAKDVLSLDENTSGAGRGALTPASPEERAVEGNVVPRGAPEQRVASKPKAYDYDGELARRSSERAAAPAAAKAESQTEESPLTDSDVHAVVSRHQDVFTACGEKFPAMKGTMMLTVVINNDGEVSTITILTEAFKGTTYAECIISEIKKILFPPFDGEPKTARLPFTVQ